MTGCDGSRYVLIVNLLEDILVRGYPYSALWIYLAARTAHMSCYSYERCTATSVHKSVGSKHWGWCGHPWCTGNCKIKLKMVEKDSFLYLFVYKCFLIYFLMPKMFHKWLKILRIWWRDFNLKRVQQMFFKIFSF